MPRQTSVTGHYVHVDPDNWMYPDDMDKERGCCESIASEIKRHVDGIGPVTIETETAAVCEFCGNPWTEDDSEFNGGCCDKDMEHEPTEE